MSGGPEAGGSIRIDRLLVYLRFARTRSAADALIAGRAVRRNRQHVLRGSEPVRTGDVLTLAVGGRIRVIQLLALPARRGPPAEAICHYREVDGGALDPKGQNTIGPSPVPDTPSGEPQDIS
jgi:ribosome-associated heat shock protein Hsp15